MMLRLFQLSPLIYYSFAFDSLLKIDVGFQIHIGILLIIALNVYFLLRKPEKLRPILKHDKTLLAFIGFAILTGVVKETPGVGQISIYLFIALNVVMFCQYSSASIGEREFKTFQWLMILTGLFQFAAYKFFGYQIAFIDAEHYEKGYSVTHRLRGFFVEPNWYAISLTFNTLLLYGNNVKRVFERNRFLTLFTVMVIVLNGTITTIGALMLIYFWHLFKHKPAQGIILAGIVGVLLFSLLVYRASLNNAAETAKVLNHSSRVMPLLRVYDFQSNARFRDIVFGHGLGSWGTKAVEHRLSVLVYKKGKATRDGSELPVFLFELGLFGVGLFSMYLYNKFSALRPEDFHLRGAVALFLAVFLLYPTLKFWMYMPYFFFAVSYINEKTVIESSKS
jgi:hypothetical protein